MHSSTSNSDFVRTIPNVPWRPLLATVALLSISAAVAWEFHARSSGYGPTLNDTPDLWAEARASVRPDSLVLIGTSRMLFDIDLDVLELGLGQRPTQLAIVGSSPFPVLADLAADPSFRGTVLIDIVPAMYLAPAGSPPVAASQQALRHYHAWNHAQRWSHRIAVRLERHLAFLQQEDLRLAKLLEKLPIPNRAHALLGPEFPPYFYSLDRDRRARMVPEAAITNSPLQQRITGTWLPLFSVPPPPTFIPPEHFRQLMEQGLEARFRDTANHVAQIQARGGRVVFLRLPVTGPLAEREEQLAPRAFTWDRLVRENRVPAIHFEEHAELRAFDCPEWSHLSAEDSVEFTRRLVPHLQAALYGAPRAEIFAGGVPRAAAHAESTP
jgi:hypothetical protein